MENIKIGENPIKITKKLSHRIFLFPHYLTTITPSWCPILIFRLESSSAKRILSFPSINKNSSPPLCKVFLMIKRRKRQIRSHENIIPRNRNENWTRTPTCSQLNALLPAPPPLILPLLILGRNMKLVATPLSLSAQQLIALIMQILLEAEASIPSRARSVVKPMHEFILILREMSNFNNLLPPFQDGRYRCKNLVQCFRSNLDKIP